MIRLFAVLYFRIFAFIPSLLFFLSLSTTARAAPHNATIRFDDPRVSFSPGWSQAAFKDSSTGLEDKFAFANEPNEQVFVNLPQNVSAVFYQGYKINGGALYFACVNCDPSVRNPGGPNSVVVDAHDDTEDGTQPAVTLFSFTNLDTTQEHVLVVTNLEDSRFSDTSQITFDSVTFTIDSDGSSSTSTTTSANGGSVPTITVTAQNPDNTSSGSTSAGATDTSSGQTGSVTTTGTDGSRTRLASTQNGTSSGQTQTASGTGAAPPSTANGLQMSSTTVSGPSSQPTSAAGTGTSSTAPESGTSFNSSGAGTNGGVSKTVIIVVAVIASLFVLALLGAITWLLVRNSQSTASPRTDTEGSAGLMREAGPAVATTTTTTVRVSRPLPLAPMRPQNPFADTVPSNVPLDQDVPVTPRSALSRRGPPSIPPRSPLRATTPGSGTPPAWLTRMPRTPTPSSPYE